MLSFAEYPTPRLIPGGLSVDDRGPLAYNNQFDPVAAGIRRFYLTSNHQAGMVRAWHAHKAEAKYVTAVSGSALVCTIAMNWPAAAEGRPSAPIHREAQRFVLSADLPAVLAIPPGYANGWMSLTPDARLMFFSTSTLEESKTDDYRFPARYWNPWKVEER
jgi:dTDP-4-dehydrorhamnose 3,5-epimerase